MWDRDICQREIDTIDEVLSMRYLSTGRKIEHFEGRMARYVGSDQCTGAFLGMTPLRMALPAAGPGDSDLVITTTFSLAASGNSVL